MSKTVLQLLRHSVTVAAIAALVAACGKDAPTAPTPTDEAVAALRTATMKYLKLDAAIADGFVFLHGCEVRGDEGPVGTVYVNMSRLTDGKIDPSLPDALIYAPGNQEGPTLVGVELAIPYTLWKEAGPPKFLDETFQREDEFGVFGLHAWVWRPNPRGMFAESNPTVSCGAQ